MYSDEWSRRAANKLKAELKLSGVSYGELVSRLADLGIEETYKGVATKITRGRFTFVFFLQCMKALGKDEIRLD
ncbi:MULTISPECIES: DUF6471 domain-containing protein [Janthinobacterium]|uniref:DUF6471 domain-containing protein n=1 Tax=Janthinobacterium violaceinigrum TaxID=2654252 RepID=A0A6I1HY01_9BURK|nr:MULTISPECIES: DUF6471 domain-containing protein [Janthinobacterium]KAB8063212.1 hypothetical protein GCN75_19790 [Janthinobacterium violaceinigrum]MED5617161.1 DUF6471 domain-containing protein [Janthinobacterium sp. P210005]